MSSFVETCRLVNISFFFFHFNNSLSDMFWRPLDLSTHLHPVSSALVWDTPSPIPHDTSPSSPTWLEQWPPNWSSCFQHLPCMHRSTTRLLFSRPVVSDSLRPHGLHAACQAFLYFTISRSLLKLMSIESLMPSNHFVLCHPLLLLPSNLSSIGLFQWARSLHQVAKVLEFQLQHQTIQWIFRTNFL